jgi:diguanylate cyclase
MARFSMGVRTRATLLALAVVLPFAFVVYRVAEDERDDARAQLSAQAQMLARLTSHRHEVALGSLRELLAILASEWDGSLLGPDCAQRLGRARVATAATSLSVAGRDGTIVCSSLPGAVGLRVDDRDYFRDALRTREIVISSLLRSKANGDHVVVVAHQAGRAGDAPEAVLVAAVRFDWLAQALADSGAPPDFEAFILPTAGGAVARFAGPGSAGPRNAALVMGEAELPGPATSRDRIHVGLPVTYADRAGDSMLRRGFAVLGGMSGFAILLAWFGSSLFVVRPLQRLTEAAARLDSGDLGARTGMPHHEHEIGRLARQLDTLAGHRQKVTRALRALSAGNRTLLREHREPELLQSMCRVAVEKGGYPLAVVYYAADDDEKSVIPAAHAGNDRGVLDAMRLTYADNERGRGTVGTAIRTGRTTVFQSIARATGAEPWREYLLPLGFASVASMPLEADGGVIGTFTLFAAETDAFDGEELELVREMADDLAFGIRACRERLRLVDAEREARHAATHDAVTDLFNRNHFVRRLDAALAACRTRGEPLAVIVLHIRNLQALVDGLGYAPGMQVLREVAQRLQAQVPEEDLLTRVPQDDFAVMRSGADAEAAEAAARELLGAFAASVSIGGTEIDVQGHAGASLFPGHGDEADLLLRRATLASRDAAKHDAPYALYAGATEREDPDRLALVAELRRAIDTRALALHYQPKYDLLARRVTGSEALLRWQHPERGGVSPVQFVPLAEQTGLIGPMTYLVIETALRQQRVWLDQGLRLPVAVNLSVRNLYDPRLLQRIEGLLATWGVPGELLHIEITEGALVADPAAARQVLDRLSALGCRTYIDDFGTGYSSLSYLVSLPVHALKIDRSFIVRMQAREALTIVSSIIGMAHGLGMRVVAEGVEREAERDMLVALGCDEAQGYLFGRPAPAEAFRASLA